MHACVVTTCIEAHNYRSACVLYKSPLVVILYKVMVSMSCSVSDTLVWRSGLSPFQALHACSRLTSVLIVAIVDQQTQNLLYILFVIIICFIVTIIVKYTSILFLHGHA